MVNARWPYLTVPFNRHVFNNGVAKDASIDLLVKRKNDTRVDVVFAKRLRKRARYVGESAGFCEGHSFR